MKWFVSAFVVMGCAFVLGCSGRGDISSEGKILQVVTCRPVKDAPPEELKKAEGAIRAIPSKSPIMQRFEWGRIDHDDAPESHYLLVLFEDPQSAYDRNYQNALREVEGVDAYVRTNLGGSRTYLVHDATPHVRTTTHGHLRRAVWVRLKPDSTLEQMQKFENAIAALPKEIPEIERLEWGAHTGYNPANPKPIDPAYRNGLYCLLFTFDSTRARDACLSHPAYKEFQAVLEQYVDGQREREFVAQVEYVARPN